MDNFDLSVCTGYDKNGFIGVQIDAFATQGRGMSAFHGTKITKGG
jgi:hypothetical protein